VTDLLLRAARLPGLDRPRDVLLRDGLVAEILPAGAAGPGELVDLDGRWLFPGLWDEHVHFTQWVLHRGHIDLSTATSAADVLARVRAALDGDRAGAVVGHGFRDGLWPDAPTLAGLDRVAPTRPVVLVSADLHCGWVNSAAAERMRVEVDASGLLRESDWMLLPNRLDRVDLPSAQAYREAADAAARRGVVGIVDFEAADNVREWPARVAAGVTALRVEASIWPARLDEAVAAGLRTGDVLDELGLVTVGRLKVVVDGSLNTRTALCHDPYPGLDPHAPESYGVQSVPPERLRDLLRTADRAGIAAAVHAIGDRANTLVIDEFEHLGRPGTVEHAQLVAVADFARFGRLGLVASIQPEHAMDDRDVADRFWTGRTDRAFAYRSLLDAGATLRFGSDAPVAPLDPWLAIAAATDRRRDDRAPWHPEQRLPLDVALAASMRGRSAVAVGDPADLVVLDEAPGQVPADGLRELPVAATLVGGRFTWDGR
jgi:predicted amidohydrolase YtcJ